MPAYEWAANPGKTYTLLFVDLTQPLLGRTVFHYLAYNVRNGAAVTKELNTTLGAWRSPGNPFGTPNKYTNLLFEHDGDLAFNKSVAAEMVGSSAPPVQLDNVHGRTGSRQSEARLGQLDAGDQLDRLAPEARRGQC